MDKANIPDNPGPAALGHTPLIGSVRRSQGMPVLREEVTRKVDETDAVDIPDSPVLESLGSRLQG